MAFPGVAETELLLALQDGAAADRGWGGFLARLADLTGAQSAMLLVRPSGSDRGGEIATAAPSGRPVAVDAAVAALLLPDRMRPERIYAAEELADLLDDAAGRSVQAALGRLGMVSMRAVRVADPGAGSLALGIFAARAFDAADGAVLRRLFPYLRAAARTAARIGQERARAAVTATLAGRSGLGWFLLDRTATVIESWAPPPGLPAGVRVLPGAHGDRLAFASRSAAPALIAILERLAADPGTAEQALWVARAPPLHLRVSSHRPGPGVMRGAVIALATLHGDRGIAPGGAGLLVDLYGLLPSEARLAVALADGGGLAEAATRLGLTVETARNYSKKVFAKTGTRGQADLTRLILSRGLAEPPR